VFINIGATNVPTITTLSTTPDVDYKATVTAVSTCTDCVEDKTTYEWYFADTLISKEKTIDVPDGEVGDVLQLVATPYNAAGVRGVSKSENYYYPFTPIITSSIIKDFSLANGVDKNTVNIKIERHRRPVNDVLVTAELDSSSAVLDNESLKTNSSGEVQFNITDTVIEPVVLTASSLDISRDAKMTFGRPTQITFVSDKKYFKASSGTKVNIKIKLSDNSGVVFPDFPVSIGGLPDLPSPIVMYTDMSGEINLPMNVLPTLAAEKYEMEAKIEGVSKIVNLYSYSFTEDCPLAGTLDCIKGVNIGNSLYVTTFPAKDYLIQRGLLNGIRHYDYVVSKENANKFDPGTYSLFKLADFDFCKSLNTQYDAPFGIRHWVTPTVIWKSFGTASRPMYQTYLDGMVEFMNSVIEEGEHLGFPMEVIDFGGQVIPVGQSYQGWQDSRHRGLFDIYSSYKGDSLVGNGANGSMCFSGDYPDSPLP
jgi:hypothetical protein